MSNYGPKNLKLYDSNNNIKRKANNTTDEIPSPTNKNVKSYSSKVGQLSSKAQANTEFKKYKELNKKQPVKVLSKEEIAELYPDYKIS